MSKSDIQELKEALDVFRKTYNSKYPNENAPATAKDIEELARDVFYILDAIVMNLEN